MGCFSSKLIATNFFILLLSIAGCSTKSGSTKKVNEAFCGNFAASKDKAWDALAKSINYLPIRTSNKREGHVITDFRYFDKDWNPMGGYQDAMAKNSALYSDVLDITLKPINNTTEVCIIRYVTEFNQDGTSTGHTGDGVAEEFVLQTLKENLR